MKELFLNSYNAFSHHSYLSSSFAFPFFFSFIISFISSLFIISFISSLFSSSSQVQGPWSLSNETFISEDTTVPCSVFPLKRRILFLLSILEEKFLKNNHHHYIRSIYSALFIIKLKIKSRKNASHPFTSYCM